MLKSKQTNVTILINTAITCCGQNSLSLQIIFKRFCSYLPKLYTKVFFCVGLTSRLNKKFSFFYHAIPFLKNANKFDRMKEPLVVFNIFFVSSYDSAKPRVASRNRFTFERYLETDVKFSNVLYNTPLTQMANPKKS